MVCLLFEFVGMRSGATLRLRDNEIDLVARQVVGHLVKGEFLQLDATETELLERVKRAIVDDLVIEDNLNREVEDILKSHAKDLGGGSIDYRKAFAMIKNKLAKDRNLILS